MNKIWLGVLLIAVVGAAVAFRACSKTPRYTAVLGEPGEHSPDGRLPQLPWEIGYAQDGLRILSRQENGEIVSWRVDTGNRQAIARTHSLFAYCPSAGVLAIGEGDNVTLVDLTRKSDRRLTSGAFHHAAWDGDCTMLALANENAKSVEIWNARDLTKRTVIDTESAVRNGLAMSKDGSAVAAAVGTFNDETGHLTSVEIFQVDAYGKATRVGLIDDPKRVVGMWTMVFSPGSQDLIVGTQLGEKSGVASYSLQGKPNWQHDGFASYWVRALTVSPDGRFVATGDERGKLRIWDRQAGDKLGEVKTDLVIQSLAFSGDGAKLAIALWDSTIGIVEFEKLTR